MLLSTLLQAAEAATSLTGFGAALGAGLAVIGAGIGIGKIGGLTAKILQGFGCSLLGFDPEPNQEYAAAYGINYVPLDKLIQEDYIDEYIITVTPTILGKGIPLFREGGKQIDLLLKNVEFLGELVTLTYVN